MNEHHTGRGPIDERSTPNLSLARLQPDDVDDLIRFTGEPRAMATLGGVMTAAATRALLVLAVEHWQRHGFGVWLARERQTLRFAGRGGLQHVEIEGRAEVELLYGFLPDFWGRGLATELARESLLVAFAELRLPSLVCFTLTTNEASRRVMEKVGFRFERQGEWAGRPHTFHRLTAAEWRASNP